MAVALKRSEPNAHILNECEYGCCTDVYGKNVKHIRRSVRRAGEREWRKDVRDNYDI